MTTLTTRPLPLLPLAIPPSPIRTSSTSTTIEQLCNDRSPATLSSSSSSSLGSPLIKPINSTTILSLQQNQNHNICITSEEMHPDNLLLQGHGVTSPRLCSTTTTTTANSTNNINNSSNIDSRDHQLGLYNNNNNNINKMSTNNNCDLTLSSTSSSSDTLRPILGAFLSIDSPKKSNNIIDNNNHNRNSSSENDSEISYNTNNNIKLNNQKLNNNNNNDIIDEIDDDLEDDTIDDRMSCCSEDSELSVGQEIGSGSGGVGCDNNNIKNSEQNNNYNNNINSKKNLNNNNNHKFLLENNISSNNFLNDKLIINNSRQQQQHNQQINMILDDSESVDNISNISDIDNRCGITSSVSVISENLPSNDDLSNDSNLNNNNNRDHLVDPTIMMATAAAAVAVNGLRIPVPIVRPSPTRIQEEFLRKSHLYAEELMKQQMQFMAAARASAFSLRHGVNNVLNSQDIGKVGFRPHIKQQQQQNSSNNQQQQQQTSSLNNDNLTNFSGIHSHLNAISKISSQLGCSSGSNESALSKFTAFGMSSIREHSQSPPQQQQQLNNNNNQNNHHMHQLHPHLPFLNNNFHEPSLKFSIDNILKADFGRRITDPLLKRNGGLNNRKHSSKLERQQQQQQQKNQTAIDLTNLISHTNNTLNQINSSGISSVSSNCSSDSNSTINALDKNQRITTVKSPSITSPTGPISSSSAQSPNSVATATGASAGSSSTTTTTSSESSSSGGPMVWPAWVYCTRYSDRPSSGPRTKKPKKPPSEKGSSTSSTDDKRPRTAFSGPQLARLKHEFAENRYLTEKRRQQLSSELGLNEAQIKIWFQNKRAKIKKSSGSKNPLALQLMAQGLYNHSTVPLTREEEELQELQAQNASSA